MRVFDTHDDPSEDADGEAPEVGGADEDEEASAPIRIIEGHAVQFNEYRY